MIIVEAECPDCSELLSGTVDYPAEESTTVTCNLCRKNVDIEIEIQVIPHTTISADQTDNGQ